MKNTELFKILSAILSFILIFAACTPQSVNAENSESTLPQETATTSVSQNGAAESLSHRYAESEQYKEYESTHAPSKVQNITTTISEYTAVIQNNIPDSGNTSDKTTLTHGTAPTAAATSPTKKPSTSKPTEKPSTSKPSSAKPSVSDTTKNNKSDNSTQTTSHSVPTTANTTTEKATQAQKSICTVSIICKTVNDNINSLKQSKKDFVPSDGIIIENATVELENGDTAFDVLKRACKNNTCKAACKYCKNNGIHIEYTYTPGFNTYYVEGIHQLYEKDCGMQSGWMYSVNGVFPNVGASSYTVKAGDTVKFLYTCDMGADIGNNY